MEEPPESQTAPGDDFVAHAALGQLPTEAEKAHEAPLGSFIGDSSNPPLALSASCSGPDLTLSVSSEGPDLVLGTPSGGADLNLGTPSGGGDLTLSTASGGPDLTLNASSRAPDLTLSASNGGPNLNLNASSAGPDLTLPASNQGPDLNLSAASGGSQQDSDLLVPNSSVQSPPLPKEEFQPKVLNAVPEEAQSSCKVEARAPEAQPVRRGPGRPPRIRKPLPPPPDDDTQETTAEWLQIQKLTHITKDISRPLEVVGPGEHEDLESLHILPQQPTKDAMVFELPSFRNVSTVPKRQNDWVLPSHYIRHQQMLRDDWCLREYECDEEDRAWIAYFQTLGKPKTHSLSEEQFECITDRLEKEYYMLLEDEGHKRTKRKAEAQAGQTLPPLGAADGPPVKRRKSEGKLTVAQLEEKSKVNVGRQRKNFKPLPSWEVLTCVGNYWQKKRAQVRAKHVKIAEDLMKGDMATWRNPELFPLASLNNYKSLLLNYSTADCRPYYTVCDHIFLIPRLQEEYKTMHNLNVSLTHRRPPRYQMDTANGLAALSQVRQQLETARNLMDRLMARERCKNKVSRVAVALFQRELLERGHADKVAFLRQKKAL